MSSKDKTEGVDMRGCSDANRSMLHASGEAGVIWPLLSVSL